MESLYAAIISIIGIIATAFVIYTRGKKRGATDAKREAENVANATSNAAFQAQNLNEKKAQNEKDKINAMPANSADRKLRDSWQRD